jgi:penicillin-binding protein 2
LVTAPSYDPGILVEDNVLKNYTFLLYRDSIAKPLYDEVYCRIPPGSPFKILTGLIGLQEGVIDENQLYLS